MRFRDSEAQDVIPFFFSPLVCLLTFKYRNALLMEDGADNFEVCAFALSVVPLLTS